MSRQQFINELHSLGYEAQDHGDGKISVPFTVEVGPRIGRTLRLGLVVGEDYPLNPPGGPHFSEALMPMNGNGGEHPHASIHPSPFGDGWQYWSRPMPHWGQTKRRASDIVAHVNRLLETLPP